MTLAELRAQRATVATQMRALHDAAEREERGFTADEQQNWENMTAEIDRIDARMARADQLARATAPDPTELRAGGRDDDGRGTAAGGGNAGGGADDYGAVFRNFMAHGLDGLTPEHRSIMSGHRAEQRAFAVGTANVGGYTVPPEFLNQLEVAMRAFGGMMQAADVMRTDTGATLPMPTFNYTNVKATIIGEGAASTTDTSTPFGSVNLGAYTYRSPLLPVSWEFLQDSAFGEGFISDALGRALSWGLNEHATIGTGTGQPRGILTDAAAGLVGATGRTQNVWYDDLVALVHSVDPAYRAGAAFMMHDSTVKTVRQMKTSDGLPIWMPGIMTGIGAAQPDTLLGYSYVVNQDMPQMAANAKSILFGALKKYKLRIVRDVTMIRLVERFADLGQVAFQLFMRADGRLLDAGTNPVKYYQNSAT